MPLSPPVGRQHLHTRRVTCQGFFREDGLWDIEGRITDEKTYEHSNEWRGPLKPGDFVHDMSIRLTVDHRFTIVDVEAVTDKSPYQDLRRRRARLQEADRAAHRRRLPSRGARAAGRRAWLHAHRRAAGAGGDHGVPDRVVGQGARAQPRASHQDRQAAEAASIPTRPSRSPTSSTTATPGRRTARWSGAGRRTSTRAPTPRRCAPPRPAKKSRWTADVRERGPPARS